MPTSVVDQLDVTEHIVRSVRGWLHALYPSEPIFLSRKQGEAESARPAFRIEIASGPSHEPAAPGVFFVDMQVVIRYASTGLWDAQRAVGKITSRASHPVGRIPLSLYNVTWPSPLEADVVVDGASTLTAGTYELAVAVEDVDGNRSAPGERVSVTVAAGEAVDLVTSAWPGNGFVRNVLLYATDEADGALHLQATQAVLTDARATDAVAFDLSAYNAAGAAPMSNQRLSFSGLRVLNADGSVVEQVGQEETYDALITLRLRCSVQRVMPL